MRLRVSIAALGAAGALAAIGCAVSYHRDVRFLRRTGVQIAGETANKEEAILAMLHWVHEELGTTKNDGYFVLPGMGATPWQVLESGGDCADKSRLLSAMLRAAGIPATMAMCFDPRTGRPSHTVVEACVGPGRFMVVDPAFDLAFPKADGAGYYDLLELRQRPSLLLEQLEQSRRTLPRDHPVHAYNRASAVYDRAATMNWNKNAVLGWLGAGIRAWIGPGAYRLPRPIVLEEPKLAAAALALGFALACIVAVGLLGKLGRGARRSLPGGLQIAGDPTAVAKAGA